MSLGVHIKSTLEEVSEPWHSLTPEKQKEIQRDSYLLNLHALQYATGTLFIPAPISTRSQRNFLFEYFISIGLTSPAMIGLAFMDSYQKKFSNSAQCTFNDAETPNGTLSLFKHHLATARYLAEFFVHLSNSDAVAACDPLTWLGLTTTEIHQWRMEKLKKVSIPTISPYILPPSRSNIDATSLIKHIATIKLDSSWHGTTEAFLENFWEQLSHLTVAFIEYHTIFFSGHWSFTPQWQCYSLPLHHCIVLRPRGCS